MSDVAKFSEFSEFLTVSLRGTHGTRTVEHPKQSVMLFTFPFDTERSVSSFLVVTGRTIQMTSSASWSNAWVTVVSGRPEGQASLSSLGLSQNLQFVKSNDQQCIYHRIFNLFIYFLLIYALQEEIKRQPVVYPAYQPTTPFWRNPEHARENLFGDTAVAIVTFKINHRKIF